MAAPTDSQTLVDESKCFICSGVNMTEGMILALLARISNSGGGGDTANNRITEAGETRITEDGQIRIIE
jgi:hypothetical protein